MKKATFLLTALSSSLAHSAQTLVLIETNVGDIPVALFDTETPETVSNFLGYVERGDYEDVIFHRLISGFVLQSGGFVLQDRSHPNLLESISIQDPIENEPAISNTRSTLAMAKLGGDPDSATSQWFVNLADNSANLDFQNGGFTVFGEVTDMTVVNEIASREVFNLGSPFETLPVMDNLTGFEIEREDLIAIHRVRVIPEPSTSLLVSLVGGCVLLSRRR